MPPAADIKTGEYFAGFFVQKDTPETDRKAAFCLDIK